MSNFPRRALCSAQYPGHGSRAHRLWLPQPEEIKHIPMVKPSGEYNIYNKTRLLEGASH